MGSSSFPFHEDRDEIQSKGLKDSKIVTFECRLFEAEDGKQHFKCQ